MHQWLFRSCSSQDRRVLVACFNAVVTCHMILTSAGFRRRTQVAALRHYLHESHAHRINAHKKSRMSHHVDQVNFGSQKPLQELEEEDLHEKTEDKNINTQGVNPFLRFAFGPSPGDGLGTESQKSSASPPRKNKAAPVQTPKDDAEEDTGQRGSKRPRLETRKNPNSSSRTSSASRVKFYNHLSEIVDHLESGLDIIICGINPGVQSAKIGHHYGNPNNHFWSCLHESGLTSRRLDPREDATLPKNFSIGLTNLTNRPTAEQNELSKAEQVSGVSALLDKVARYRPRILCVVGLGIADIVKSQISIIARLSASSSAQVRSPTPLKGKATVGLQPYKFIHSDSEGATRETLFFAVSSTSGRVVRYQKADKIRQFQDLRDLLERVKNETVDTSTLLSVQHSGLMLPKDDEGLNTISQESTLPLA
ncbi:uracil-DNA glycosylase-like protein [Gymnopilus junonius]|uniref:Uracil-DNA glycosylase-like protein n=1 Tax=Gymnopilus junonius TaxID=109634 RepID=A0A9P5ND68_GYMJU|nr:uracil-DNA glycosylase-like protein [Gymnopilus junonius]